MFNLVHIELNMRVHLQILVVSRVDLVLDVLFQIGHLNNFPASVEEDLQEIFERERGGGGGLQDNPFWSGFAFLPGG